LSQLLSKVTVAYCFFTSYFQCFRPAAGRRTLKTLQQQSNSESVYHTHEISKLQHCLIASMLFINYSDRVVNTSCYLSQIGYTLNVMWYICDS